jgi:NitT/TauT family transport system ATP-binding protein
MKQRVAIARVLVNDPAVMLMDEPFSALDTFTRTTLQKELLRIWQETHCTIVFVTHNVEEAVLLGAKVVVMNRTASGGSIIDEVAVDLPRPRDTTGAEFNELKRRVLQALDMDARV